MQLPLLRTANARAGALAVAAIVLAAASAGAQTAPIDPDSRAKQDVQTIPGATAAPTESILDSLSGEVTFEQVLKDPDNAELNFRFARQQIRRGDLLGASSTLERVLARQPDLHRVRLLYAIVLFRMQSREEALIEFKRLESAPLGASDKAEVQRYVAELERAFQATRFTASLTLGPQYDTNRNSVSEARLVQSFLGTAKNPKVANAELGFLAVGTLGVRHDLGSQDGHEAIADILVYSAMNSEEQQLDALAFQGSAGVRYRTDWLDIVPQVKALQVHLDSASFLTSYGLEIALEREFTPRLSSFFKAYGGQEDFHNTGQSPTNDFKSGPRYSGEIGGRWAPFSRLLLNTSIQGATKIGKKRFERFDEWTFNLGATVPIGGGAIFGTSASHQIVDYKAADRFVSLNKERFDRVTRIRMMVGAPLGLIPGSGSFMPAQVRDIRVTGLTEYVMNESNILQNDFRNLRAQLLFTKRWEF